MTKTERQYLRELLDEYVERLIEERRRPLGDRMLPTPGLEYRRGILLGFCGAFRLDVTEGAERIEIRNGVGAMLASVDLAAYLEHDKEG